MFLNKEVHETTNCNFCMRNFVSLEVPDVPNYKNFQYHKSWYMMEWHVKKLTSCLTTLSEVYLPMHAVDTSYSSESTLANRFSLSRTSILYYFSPNLSTTSNEFKKWAWLIWLGERTYNPTTWVQALFIVLVFFFSFRNKDNKWISKQCPDNKHMPSHVRIL